VFYYVRVKRKHHTDTKADNKNSKYENQTVKTTHKHSNVRKETPIKKTVFD